MQTKKEKLKQAYNTACNNYLYQLLEDWCDDDMSYGEDGFWVSDEPGGVYCLNEDVVIGMDDIVYCVDNDVTYDDYLEYLDYNAKCYEYGFDHMNLKSFIKGAPRVSDEAFERLDGLKQNLSDAIDKIKEQQNKGGF